MTPIRAVLFDYGLVLSGPPDPAAWQRMQSLLGAGAPAFHDAYWKLRHAYDLGDLNGREYWKTVAQELGSAPSDAVVDGLIEADIDLWTVPNQPMIDWAGALQQAGVPTGILSNIGDEMETGVLERCPWLGGFAHRTFSHRLRIAKPDHRIYRHAIEALGSLAAETLFLDDRIENVQAAIEVGLQAIHYTAHDEFVRRYDDLGCSELPRTNAATNSGL